EVPTWRAARLRKARRLRTQPAPGVGSSASFALERVGCGFCAAHRGERPTEQARGQADRDQIGGGDERPGIHSLILRIRASTLASASSARIRINTAAPNRQVNPTNVIGSGQRIELSIV